MIKIVTKFFLCLFLIVTLTDIVAPSVVYAQASNQEQEKKTHKLKPVTAKEYIDGRTAFKEKWGKYSCYQDTSNGANDGPIYCVVTADLNKDDASLITRGTGIVGGKRKGCDVISVEWYNSRGCAFCNLLQVPYHASDLVAAKSFKTFAPSFAGLIVIIFAIWLGIKTLSHVSFVTTQDAAKYINDILVQAFKFLISFTILFSYHWIFDSLILPIFDAGLNFADAFVATGMEASDYDIKYNLLTQTELFGKEIYTKMAKFAFDVNMNFSLLQTVGKVMRCLGGKYLTGFNVWESGINFGLGVNCIIYGVLFGLIGFLLCLAFVFYLFDAVVELGMFGAVLPFAIACWPFKMFSKATGTTVKLFMNSTFTFMMAGVAVKICVALISNALGATSKGNNKGLEDLIKAVDTLDVNALKDMVGSINISFLVFACAGLSGFLLVGKIQQLTNMFASGGIQPKASKIATMAASAVKGTAKKVAAPTVKAVEGKVQQKVSAGINKVAQSKFGQAVGKGVKTVGALTAGAALGGPVGAAVVGGVKLASAIGRRRQKKKAQTTTTGGK